MFRKSTLMLILLCVAALATGSVAEQLFQKANPIATFEPLIAPSFRAPCVLQKTNLSAASYYDGYTAGMGTYTYFDPAVECAGAPYPYSITDFTFTLYDDGAGNSWPATLDIVIYSVEPAGICPGLGTELCRYTMTPDQATFLYPNAGTFNFPTPCCVDGPFYIGVEYPAGTTTPVVSLLFDDQVADPCENWMWVPGAGYFNWDDFWTPPAPGWPIFIVGGETNATICDPVADCPIWDQGSPYKSENPPQLPDESGWDVNATFPKVLADDFMCGETGYIKDIHFWGSWLDGNPGTVKSFILSFHSTIPNASGYDIPSALLWEREITVFTETPIDALTLEGWYDPYTGDVKTDNHNQYMQYDVCLSEEDWFPQEVGTIYWLNISAIVEPSSDGIDRLWGWKSTQDHWNSDAVYHDCLSQCIVPDSSGNVHLPADCPIVPTLGDSIVITSGLPPGSSIQIFPEISNYSNLSEVIGGGLGGTVASADVSGFLHMTGTGALSGFSRMVSVSGQIEFEIPSRAATGSYPTEMIQMQLTAVGDPDFDLINLTAGTTFGLPPSVGIIGISALGSGNYQIDSFFDINYDIDYQGAPGSVLNGMSGLDQGSIRLGHEGSGNCEWVEMYEPDVLGPISNDFNVFVDPQGQLVNGGGTDAFQEGWYQYPSGWLNIWFYDHPFDPNRYKTMHVEFDIHPLDPAQPMFVEFALNWSTDAWSNGQLPGDSSPPLPGEDEALYIGRQILLEGDQLEGHFVFDFDVQDYNPEWVSIDVRGFNFAIPGGRLTHQCIGNGQSLDLSFVITGDPNEISGACCLPDGSCIETNAGDCAAQGGDYQGVGTDCASADCQQPNNPPFAKCQDIILSADANCEGCATVAMVDAGSYDPDGDPITITLNPPCPYPLGVTLVELTVTDDAGATDKCTATVTVEDNTPPVPICPADMTVIVPAGSGGGNVTFAISATDNCPGVVVSSTPASGSFFPVGVTTVTVVAVDAAGLSATCTFKVTVRENPPVFECPPWAVGDLYKSENPPQLPDEAGWNVNATAPKTLADDFMCGETGWIKDLHFWGSWLDGKAGNIQAFIISFHEDIPASPSGEHSRPGKLLYEHKIEVFDALVITGAYMEGWYDPWTGEVLSNNHQEYWQYDICLDQDDWFRQEQGTIYWLNISAIVEVPPDGTVQPKWGWKSSVTHWNDDAVHLEMPDLTCSVVDSGGTVNMPPEGCPLVPQDGGKIVISEGLPQGTTIEIEIVAMNLRSEGEFANADGTHSSFQTEIVSMSLTGTGALSGFSRTMSMSGPGEMHFDPRVPPDPIQTFDTEILSMDLSLFGDPDFDVLRLRAGSNHALPSPGHTTLSKHPSGNWSADSFFDVTYEVEFVGAVGGPLDGMAGTTPGTIRMGTDDDSDDNGDWREMYEPLHVLGPILNSFGVEVDESGNVVNGFGEDAYGDGWYNYPTNQWWNIWFYDHPFDANRFKQIHVEFDVILPDPTGESQLEFALNWSTDAWANDQPATDSTPPLPGTDEALYIQREILLNVSSPDGHYSFDYIIDDYNPEWVSIDVRGFNFLIDGILAHECIGDGVGQSMDLAFVITGDTVSPSTGGACCQPDGTCSNTDAASCAANSGVYQGDGTLCSTANICDPCGWYTNGFTGNTNCDTGGKRNLADITVLIDHVYIGKQPLCSDASGNVDGDDQGKRNLADITFLIDHVYINKPETAPCQ